MAQVDMAVIDRIEGDVAVLLVSRDEREVVAPRAALPTSARPGDWLLVEVEGDRIVRAEVDAQETLHRAERLRHMREMLRRRQDA
ncbi:MAG: DUF3006 domain-containing protein [Chloroflexi bacterium]|nr:DUF3006 domain-containing protein [Chloroflexota bacterium]